MYMLNCKINGTVHFFSFFKSLISAPGDRNSPSFFPVDVYPLYFHVIIDFSHI